ncbi:uncharacterized protein LOC125721878 isoform X2 [Brienomyrus brachyistius]|uniref:uncharacterized protein LOC125721878 isoform X2 n=1 Tax=Brienomyrus brachyistius TaxID=42636 RepID=UPI0020B1BE10|nr:uncharacterized protein LOC125721878 isoform X2 [Brienomyrus brachyistius]
MNHPETIEMNHYESDPPSQDVYETLHSKPAETRFRSAGVQQSPDRKKLVFILLTANTLLLVTILVMVAVHLDKSAWSIAPPTDHRVSQPPPFPPNNEEWYLHEDTFYLFWSGQGSCEEAKGFCTQRGAQLLTVDSRNEAWVKSVISGRQVWVQGFPSAGSGEMWHIIYKDFDDMITPGYEDLQCDVFPSCTTASGCHGPADWMCQRA